MSPLMRRRINDIVVLIASIAALLLLFRNITMQYVSFRPMPYWDQWDFTKHVPDLLSGKYSIADLFAFHNEHRIVTSKLVFIADALLFSSAGFFPSIILTCTLIALAILLCAVTATGLRTRICTSAIVSSLLLSTAHWENLASGFQVQFPFVDLCAALSIGLFCCAQPRTNNAIMFVVGSIIADILAIFSMASGNLVVFSLIFVGVILRIRFWKVAAVALVSVLVSVFYFSGFPDLGIAHSYNTLGLLHFSFAYLGAALRGYAHAPVILGTILVVLYGAVLLNLVRNWLRGAASDPILVWLVGFAGFLVGGAMTTATGRLSLGLETATSSRYAIQSLLFAACLFLIGWRTIDLRGYGRIAKVILATLTLTVSATSTFAELPLREWRERVTDYDVAGFALASGIIDDRATQGIYPKVELIRSTLEFMGHHHMGPFSAAYASVYRPPTNATALENIDQLPLCEAYVDEHTALSSDQTWATGWIFAKDAPTQDGWVLAFSSTHQLLGAARQSIFRPDVAVALSIHVTRVGYRMGLNSHGVPLGERADGTLVLVPGQATAPTCRSPLPLRG